MENGGRNINKGNFEQGSDFFSPMGEVTAVSERTVTIYFVIYLILISKCLHNIVLKRLFTYTVCIFINFYYIFFIFYIHFDKFVDLDA
jgi:hypothetical protein